MRLFLSNYFDHLLLLGLLLLLKKIKAVSKCLAKPHITQRVSLPVVDTVPFLLELVRRFLLWQLAAPCI